MPFPSAKPLAETLQRMLHLASAIKSTATLRHAELASAARSADYVLDIHRFAHEADGQLAAYAQVSGLPAYAQSQLGADTLDIAAEFVALRAALQAVRDHIEASVPVDDGGTPYFLTHQFTAHQVAPRSFPSASPAIVTLRSLLQTVIDAID